MSWSWLAGELLTRSSENFSISSARVKISCVPSKLQPSRGEVVEEGVGQVALLDVLVKIDQDAELLVFRDLALGHLRLRARLGDVGNMGKGRQARAQRLEEQELREGVGEVLVGPDDVGDLHRDVVDDAGEVVKRSAIGPDDDEIADLVGRELDVPLDQVVEDERSARRDLKPQREGTALGLELGGLLVGERLRRNR